MEPMNATADVHDDGCEVWGNEPVAPRCRKVGLAAVDVGIPVTPDIIVQQAQSATILGLSAALTGRLQSKMEERSNKSSTNTPCCAWRKRRVSMCISCQAKKNQPASVKPARLQLRRQLVTRSSF
jgi:hypothetical protein